MSGASRKLKMRRFWVITIFAFVILLAIGFADAYIRQGLKGPLSVGFPIAGGVVFMHEDEPPQTIFGSLLNAALLFAMAMQVAWLMLLGRQLRL
jgi:hypothetical protein